MDIYNDEILFANVEYKADNSPITMADSSVNEIIVAGLRKHFPEYTVLSEEKGIFVVKREENIWV